MQIGIRIEIGIGVSPQFLDSCGRTNRRTGKHTNKIRHRVDIRIRVGNKTKIKINIKIKIRIMITIWIRIRMVKIENGKQTHRQTDIVTYTTGKRVEIMLAY